MNEREARKLLEQAEELVPFANATIDYCKDMLKQCLAADIPAALVSDDPESMRAQLLVRTEDAEQVARLLDSEWRQMAQQEGTFDPSQVAHHGDEPEGEPPCPACGATDPLVDGACPDCGLVLASDEDE